MTTPINVGTDHIRGSVNAPIVIVEYGDYECPYTGLSYRQGNHEDENVQVAFRNFPLNEIHPHAQ